MVHSRRPAEQQRDLAAALGEAEQTHYDMQVVLQTVRDGIIVLDSVAGVTFCNAAYGEIVGLARPATSGNELTLLAEDGTVVPFGQWPLQRVLRGEWADPPTIYRLITPDGKRKIVEIEGVPLRSSSPSTRVLGVVRDITVGYGEARNAEILRELTHRCSAAIETKDVAHAALDILTELLQLGNCTILVRDVQRPSFAKIVATRNGPELTEQDLAQLTTLAEATPITADAPLRTLAVMATGEAFFNQTPLPLEAQHVDLQHAMHSVAYLPLKVGHDTIGVLMTSFTPRQDRIWEAPHQMLLQAAADEIALALHRARLYEATQRLALFDPLTGLRNHRALQQLLGQEVTTASRLGLALSVVMLDVDHFRRFNETFGHDVGDQALQAVAKAIAASIRSTDFAARYGGEEFTIILPATDTTQAAISAERMRAAIADIRLAVVGNSDPITVTASLGIATYPLHASMPPSLLKAADIALYASKHAGRNRVTAYTPALAAQTDDAPALPPHATLEMVQALIMGIDLRDGFTASHSEEVARLAAALGVQMGLAAEEVERLRLAGLVHDVGKIAVPEHILTKRGALTADEWVVMQQHVLHGERLLSGVAALHDMLPFVRWHHERLDGSGYPDGLRGDAIPLALRILSVADVFEAYTAARPYHPRRSVREGVALLRHEVAGGRLDGAVVAALSHLLQETPPSTAEVIALVA